MDMAWCSGVNSTIDLVGKPVGECSFAKGGKGVGQKCILLQKKDMKIDILCQEGFIEVD